MPSQHGPIVVGIGEILWDVFPDRRRPGGAPANVAFHANQLGMHGIVYSRVGRDELGDELLAFLVQHGLQTDYVFRDAHYPTGQAEVSFNDRGEPEFRFVPNVAWDHLDFHAAAETLMNSAAAVSFGTLAQREEDARNAIHQCLAAVNSKTITLYDANLRPPHVDREWIERSFAAARIVKVREDEAKQFASILDWKQYDLQHFAYHLRERYDVDLVCVTRGPRGCVLFAANETAEQAGVPLETVDPVGAGDAFAAALLFARLRSWSLTTTADFANRYAALVASRPGAMPRLEKELSELLQSFDALPPSTT